MIQWLENNSGKVFLFLLFLIFFLLGFQVYLFLQPIGLHYVRQTDSLAFVDFYQNNGFNFFEPGGWFLGDSDGKTAGEFPVLYYLTAILDDFFGFKHVVLRAITFSISIIGFYHLFKLSKLLLKDVFYAIGLTLLLLSSTVILYYSVNFLPDASALGLTLSAYYFGLKNHLKGEKIDLKKAMILFSFAGLLKVTFLIHTIALVSALFLNDWKSIKSFKLALKNNARRFLGLTLVVLIVSSWYIYAQWYNEVNNSNVFLTRILPIWELNSAKIGRIWLAVRHDWFSAYYYQTTFHVLLVLILLGLFIRIRQLSFFSILLFVLGIGTLAYILLFFNQFLDHDYYMLNVAPFLFLWTLFSIQKLMVKFNPYSNHFIPKILVFLFVGLSFHYASFKLKERYTSVSEVHEKNVSSLVGIDAYLDKMKIPKNAKFALIGEENYNGAFYWMNRSGWIAKPSISGLKEKMLINRQKTMEYVMVMPGFEGFDSNDFPFLGVYKGIKIYRNSQFTESDPF